MDICIKINSTLTKKGNPQPIPKTNVLYTDSKNSVFYSESKTAEPAINGNEALHTAAIYTSASYIGDVVAQATLDSTVTESTHWGDVATVTFTGAEDTPIPVNFNGVFNHLRFKTTASPTDKISKILVRN